MAKKLNKKAAARREFLRSLILVGGVTGLSLTSLIPTLSHSKPRLRPPGALLEKDYLAACIKCGQCVQVCPVEAIFLGDVFDGQGAGAAYIDARDQACDFSCDGLQCVLACPTGALTHHINYAHETRMGMAKLSKPQNCLAIQGKGFSGVIRGKDYQGKLRFEAIDRWNPISLNQQPFDLDSCDLCVRLCPIEIRKNQCEAGTPPSGDVNQCPPAGAIRLEKIGKNQYKPVIESGCVGCGVCEMVCPVTDPAIVIEKRATYQEVYG